MADGPRYGFHPLERRGLILGLDAGQLSTIGGAAVTALAVRAVVGGAPGSVAAVLLATAGIVGAVWTTEGRPVGARMVVAVAWLLRRGGGPVLDDLPVSGIARGSTAPAAPCRHRRGTAPRGIELLEDGGMPGDGPLGIVRDRVGGTWAGVIPVRGCSFSLLDASDQADRLEGWRRVLGAVARPGSPVVRLQWVQRTWTGAPDGLRDGGQQPDELCTGPPAAVGAYRRLLDSAMPAMTHHQSWLALVVGSPHRHPGKSNGIRPTSPAAGVETLRRELRLLEGQLRAAALDPLRPLDLADLGELIGRPSRPGAGTGAAPWPLAADEEWAAYRADGMWHATYWISEWPRVEVGPDFLAPLLVGPARAAISVLMAPVAADRALREVRSARTADIADAELRARAGFLQSTRRDRESEGVARREAELADGHHEFRFTGYLTVSAPDADGLTAACAQAEHAAQSARLEIRRLFGRQAEAYTWTLPLGRGLRQGR